jgi:AraC-like DNA-binding protein
LSSSKNPFPGPQNGLPRIPYKEWLYLNTRLLWVYDDFVQPYAIETERHVQNFAVWLMKEGSVRVSVDGQNTTVKEGQWVFLRPGHRRQHFTQGAKILSVHFQASWPNGRNLFKDGLSLVVESEDFPKLEHNAQKLLDAYRRLVSTGPRNNITWESIEALNSKEFTIADFMALQKPFSGWLIAFYNCLTASGLSPTRISDIHQAVLQGLHMIDEMPMDETFDRNAIAARMGMSASNADRLFLNYEGRTMYRVYEDNRLRYAREQLALEVSSIKALAFHLGFTDLANFSRWFKRHTALSPRAYRKKFGLEAVD